MKASLWKKVQVFDTPQVVNCFKVESDAALLWLNGRSKNVAKGWLST